MSQARCFASFPPRAAVALACLAVAAAPRAQLADLQPGRNFMAEANFGLNRSAEIDAGDADNDGDLDVVVANGMDFGNEPNRIFINQGGLQGGLAGAFLEETATRFAGMPADKSRDIEFVDIEDDGDLDLCVANDGGGHTGQPSRFHVNLGGVQAGTTGFYSEVTDTAWGALVSVPAADQILGGNQGPFRGFSCDCDFADLDDDGDSDLFWSSYGPVLSGSSDSLVFLNGGSGVFDEFWPWADPAADTKVHVIDADLADFDGDFQIDIFLSSRDSQARVYVNNGPGANPGFSDLTQSALLDTGAANPTPTNNYEVEYQDLDGDADLDLWLDNYGSNSLFHNRDIVLANVSPPGGPLLFELLPTAIKGDPQADEDHISFLDFDGDGDLDVHDAIFSGTNYTYTSSLAQGGDPLTTGIFQRNGTAASQAPWHELPATLNGFTSIDGDAADIDNDGDDDILVANDGNQQNYLYRNALGIPDAHAPTFIAVTQQVDLTVASPAVIHAAVRDNHAWYVIARHDTRLVWSVDGGLETTVAMFSQGGQQFRGVIPAVTGLIDYRVECTDRAGNTGVSGTLTYIAGPPSPWTDLGFALSGAGGAPVLSGTGTLAAGSPGSLDLAGAVALAPALLFLALGSTPTPFKGGTLAAFPPVFLLALSTSATGAISLPWPAWPPAIAPGTVLVFQYAIQDAGAVQGVALSNALQGVAP